MTELEQVRQEIKSVVRMTKLCFCASIVALVILLATVLGLTLCLPSNQVPPAPVTQTANPVMSTQVTTGNELDHIKGRAEKRGYYHKDEFAKVMGMSERTLDRRIENGRVFPEPHEAIDGRIAFPLDTEISH